MKHLVEYLIEKVKGERYEIDNMAPISLIYKILAVRGVMFIRGILKHPIEARKRRIFLGKSSQILGMSNLQLNGSLTLETGAQLDALSCQKCWVGKNFKLGRHSRLVSTSVMSQLGLGFSIGDNVGFNDFCYIGSQGGVTIGNDTIFGPYTAIFTENHNFSDGHETIRLNNATRETVVIGSNCWIGARVTILAGSRLGDNVVVAAGSIVNGEIPNNSLVTGYHKVRLNYIGN